MTRTVPLATHPLRNKYNALPGTHLWLHIASRQNSPGRANAAARVKLATCDIYDSKGGGEALDLLFEEGREVRTQVGRVLHSGDDDGGSSEHAAGDRDGVSEGRRGWKKAFGD
jgi:hypothetical protein